MANEGTRAVVQDPLAPNAREQRPNRSLQVGGVQTPNVPSAASLTRNDGLSQALQGVEGILQQEFEKKKDEWITEGKVAYQSGVTEQAIIESGNAFSAQGYRTMQARDNVNKWFTDATVTMDETGKQMDPQQYAAHLKEQRASVLNGITDPAARKVASAAFEEMSPRLAQTQAIKHNEYNRVESTKAFSSLLFSTGPTSATASQRPPGGQLSISPVPVGAVLTPSAKDRDIGIRTMLGEAANEGAEGLAAVAHVLKNRTTDGRWPSTIEGVSLQPKQFSAWNEGAGGNSLPRSAKPGSPIYERAGEVFDAVMAGKHVDPTGGATHYYSPAGMQKLVADGDQSNVVPKWLDDETARSGGRIKIGGHIFVGKATSSDAKPAPQNEVQALINQSSLKPEDKAAAVADAMRRSLDAGDDKLFNDAGGVASLHGLSAKPNDIDEVLKAKKRFDEKKMTEFSSENVKFENDIKKRAEDGESLDSILTDIDKRKQSGLLNDANARVLASGAADKIRAANGEKSKMGNPDMLNELGGLYQQISTGGDFKSIAEQGTAIAKKYGATEKDVQQIVGKMFSDSQQYQNNLRTVATAAAKTKAEQDTIRGTVDRSLAHGYGLKNATGSVKITNDAGQPETVSAEEYGIRQIKDKWGKQYADAVSSGKITAAQAKPELERKVMLELQNHDVVDKQTQAQLVGSLSGNIITKDGTIKPAAVQAYDTYLTLKTTPGISPGYLSKVVGDEPTRNLLEHAMLLDQGTLSKEQALLKAHEILNDPTRDPNDRITKDAIWKMKLDVDLNKVLLERTHPGFLASVFNTGDRNERERILTDNAVAKRYVMDRAEAYHLQEPRERGEVSLEKALQDLQANSVPVMGNLIITKPGKELDKTMGVQGFGPGAAEEAISSYIRKNGATLWGEKYTAQENTTVGNVVSGIGNFDRQFSPQGIARAISPKTFDSVDNYKGSRADAPPVSITYNAELGIMTVDLYKDRDMKQTIGSPKHFNVKAIGAEYVKEQNTPGTWAKTWNKMFKAGMSGLSGDNIENVYNAN